MLRFKSAPNYEAGRQHIQHHGASVRQRRRQRLSWTVTVTVTNADEAGTLTLSTLQPVDGIELTTTLTDIDGAVTDVTYKWAKSSRRTGSYTVIEGETASLLHARA